MKKTHITLAVLATAVTVVSASQAVNAKLVISQNSNSTTIVQAPTTATSTTTDTKTISTQGANYTLDPAHANVRFAIDHYGTTTNQGGFYGVTGRYAIGAEFILFIGEARKWRNSIPRPNRNDRPLNY